MPESSQNNWLLDAGRYGLTHMDVLMPQSQGCERAALSSALASCVALPPISI